MRPGELLYLRLLVTLLVSAMVLLAAADVRAEVELSSFTATAQGDRILVEWATVNKVDIPGFNVMRSTQPNSGYAKINSSLIPGCAGCLIGANYSQQDAAVTRGQLYYYKLQTVDPRGNPQEHGPVSAMARPAPTATATRMPSATPTPFGNNANNILVLQGRETASPTEVTTSPQPRISTAVPPTPAATAFSGSIPTITPTATGPRAPAQDRGPLLFTAAAVMVGALGMLAFIALVGFLLWFTRR